MQQVTRPKASEKKIHSKKEFELCYLRHQYLRRATGNPTEAELAPYMHIVKNLSGNTFTVYRNLLHMSGFGVDDVINVGRVHLTSYLSLFSIFSDDNRQKAFEQTFFMDKGRTPTEDDLMNKDKANLTVFMKQRMEDLVRVCRQKARNIKGLQTDEFTLYVGPTKPPKILNHIFENHEKYGFKKIDHGAFRSAKKKAKSKENVFEYEGLWFVAIPVGKRALCLEDFSGAGLDPHDNIHNMGAESMMLSREAEFQFESKKAEFDGFSDDRKIRKIKYFIRMNRTNKGFCKEVDLARKLLRELENKA